MSRFGLGFLGTFGGNDAFTRSLLHFDGTNGSTSFPDTAAGLGTNLVWGNAGSGSVLSTATVKFGTASLLNNGGSQHIETADNAAFNALGTTPFVFDCWINTSNSGSQMYIAGIGFRGAAYSWYLVRDAANTLTFTVNASGALSVTTSGTVSSAGWHHVACITDGTNIFIALDGVVTTGPVRGSIASTAAQFAIGTVLFSAVSVSLPWVGNIDEARLSIGTTRGWTSNFVPFTTAYTL